MVISGLVFYCLLSLILFNIESENDIVACSMCFRSLVENQFH